MPNHDAMDSIADFSERNGFGKGTYAYKLRDWLISRQRYWGTPIPVSYCNKCGIVPVPYDELPVLLPSDVEFGISGNPLATSKSFVNVNCPRCKGQARRETDTMDTFVDSSWYFFRFCSPYGDKDIFDRNAVDYWMPVEQYIGGIEHAVMHLLYSRFFTKALRDMGLHSFDEPFKRLLCQGMVIKDGAKMSKSIGNVVNPEEIIERYGADTARMFMLFTALPEKELNWSEQGVEGSFRFLNRLFNLTQINSLKVNFSSAEKSDRDKAMLSKLHRTIGSVTEYIEEFKLSLAIGSIMEFVNEFQGYLEGKANKDVYDECIERVILLISPFTPHIAEEMWECIGKDGFVSLAEWHKSEQSKIDLFAERTQEIIANTISDIRSVIEITKLTPKKIILIIADDWKFVLFGILIKEIEGTRDLKEIRSRVMAIPELKKHSKEVANIVQRILKDITKLPKILVEQKKEHECFVFAKLEIEKRFNADVNVVWESESKEAKARNAMPNKPGVVIG